MTEEEISMILNTYMYLDYKEADDGMKMKEIVEELAAMPDCQAGGIHYGEYQVLSKAVADPEIGELAIDNQSHLMGYDTGTAACTFASEETGSIYVVYRGTGDGEWLDNGEGMTARSTLQQERALHYFETVVERAEITEGDRLIVTGHSKGGNKAQYVTMSTRYDSLLDACYNIDGQGFSEKAIAGWKESYGQEGYEARTEKITGIFGENDYVNVLGISIVPEDQIYYVKTPVEKGNVAGYHDIKYLFASMETDPVTGEVTYNFHGEKNDYVMERGEFAAYAAVLSDAMMNMEPEKREGCAASIMQLMELGGNRKTGLNGEKLEWSDAADFLSAGIPMIAQSLLTTEEGTAFLSSAFGGKSFACEMKGSVLLMADSEALRRKSELFQAFTAGLKGQLSCLEDTADKLAQSMKNSWILRYRLNREKDSLSEEIQKLQKLSGNLEEIAALYQAKDEELAESMSSYFSSLSDRKMV